MKSTLKKEDAARESTPRTAIEESRARAYGSEKLEVRVIQRAIYGYHQGPFTWRTRRAVPKKYQRSIERFLVIEELEISGFDGSIHFELLSAGGFVDANFPFLRDSTPVNRLRVCLCGCVFCVSIRWAIGRSRLSRFQSSGGLSSGWRQ